MITQAENQHFENEILSNSECICCGIRDWTLVGEKYSYSLIQCNSCYYIRMAKIPQIDEIKEIYQDDYFRKDNDSLAQNQFGYSNVLDPKAIKGKRKIARNRIRRIQTLIPRGATVLDVGCSEGSFIEEISADDYQVSGVEWNKMISSQIQERGIEAKIYDDLAQVADTYDLITMWDVLEHLSAPCDVIEQIKQQLNRGGMLALSVPNSLCVPAKTDFMSWSQAKPPEHVHYWNLKNISSFLEREGFTIIEARYYGVIYRQGIRDRWGSRSNPKSRKWIIGSILYHGSKFLDPNGGIKNQFNLPAIGRLFEGVEIYAIRD